jgi:hypothetical protein
MSRQYQTFYRYRAFSTATLESLCLDTLHFANPGSFNDPLDCNPTVECDCDIKDLRTLLTLLAQRRVSAEVLESLKRARLFGDKATAHANSRAQREAAAGLADIAYHATNPEYAITEEEAEADLLTQEIEQELRRRYDRGVCCFSTTYANPLLWSHYGDQHHGLCIGYGTDRTPRPTLQRVIYGGSRALKTSTLMRAFVHDASNAKNELDRDVLLRKARGWGYEREYRLIGEQGIQNSPMLMKDITFGLRCPRAVKHAVVCSLGGREKPVNFYEVYEVRSRYVLRRRALDFDGPASLPRTAASGEEIFASIGLDDDAKSTGAS